MNESAQLLEVIDLTIAVKHGNLWKDLVKNISFEGITFTQAKRSVWSEDHKGWGIQHDWDTFDFGNAMLRFRGAENMKVSNSHFTNSAGSAIRLVSDWAYYNHGYTSNILNTPADDAIAYERSSPIYFAQGLTKPLLINAPMVDDNVFFEDTVRLVQRLIELEKEDFETAIYPVEPHGFVQPSSWLDEYRRIYKLFETNL